MLEVNQLQVAYRKQAIIPDLTLQPLQQGQLVSLLGPNGSGKSTLLKALAGLLPLKHGSVRLNGQNLNKISFEQRAQHVVYLPQSLPASVHLRVLESVLVAARASALSADAGQVHLDQVMMLLQRLGIEHLSMHYLDQLSGGQKQLVGLAQALIRRPRLLLLDEPLSALDLNYQFHVMDLLRQETHEHGLITLIVLHDLNVALRHSDYAVMIKGGTLLGEGTPATVITPAALADGYGVETRIEPCSRGMLQVLIDGLQAPVR
ncbi:ABC transporter ATP-binding protein [Pollutimonas harenae]|uniref:ABC transporter ATP-binding protein n=1 Tax=Pollutimonas harenae TaxID=657015 RepID=A0A853GVI9_9BURK|nr:ABC transporter ATP-binding protein [Pollutimonas harenae]NYT86157.1 ABC transporter ATP-binding protein [Pollutimonas harenae]TEA71194.1 ABC transporter ATP-binding protein [Pollutimonas harenae]